MLTWILSSADGRHEDHEILRLLVLKQTVGRYHPHFSSQLPILEWAGIYRGA